MENKLSTGHLSEKHINSHKFSEPLKNTLGNYTGFITSDGYRNPGKQGERVEINIQYKPEVGIHKEKKDWIQTGGYKKNGGDTNMRGIFQLINNLATPNLLFNSNSTMSPYLKRKGKIIKIVRPLRVPLGLDKETNKWKRFNIRLRMKLSKVGLKFAIIIPTIKPLKEKKDNN